MTNVYAPTGKVLENLEVSDEKGERLKLPDALKGKTTLLFMATKAKHAELFESVYSIWRSTFGVEHEQFAVCYVSLLRDSPTLDIHSINAARDAIKGLMETTTVPTSSNPLLGEGKGTEDMDESGDDEKHGRRGRKGKANIMNTVCLTSTAKMNAWLWDMNIPTVFLDIYDDEYEEETDTSRDTLDFPIVMLLDPQGLIRHCVLGLEVGRLDSQRNTLLELVSDARPKATTEPPKNAPPVSSKVDSVGIGTYEFFGVY